MQISTQHKINYLTRRHQEWGVAERALEQKDLSPLAEIGHKWKGNGATFGFPELGELGAQLETAASLRQFTEAEKLIARFREWLAEHPVEQVEN